jgi:hypothetical protein
VIWHRARDLRDYICADSFMTQLERGTLTTIDTPKLSDGRARQHMPRNIRCCNEAFGRVLHGRSISRRKHGTFSTWSSAPYEMCHLIGSRRMSRLHSR